MDETKILIPEKRAVLVGGREYKIGKISMRIFLLLLRYLTKLLAEKKDFVSHYADAASGSKTIMQDIQILTTMLEPSELAAVVAIYLDEPDVKFIEDNMSMEDFSAVLAVFCELTDFEYLKKNFNGIQNALKPKQKTETTKVI